MDILWNELKLVSSLRAKVAFVQTDTEVLTSFSCASRHGLQLYPHL